MSRYIDVAFPFLHYFLLFTLLLLSAFCVRRAKRLGRRGVGYISVVGAALLLLIAAFLFIRILSTQRVLAEFDRVDMLVKLAAGRVQDVYYSDFLRDASGNPGWSQFAYKEGLSWPLEQEFVIRQFLYVIALPSYDVVGARDIRPFLHGDFGVMWTVDMASIDGGWDFSSLPVEREYVGTLTVSARVHTGWFVGPVVVKVEDCNFAPATSDPTSIVFEVIAGR